MLADDDWSLEPGSVFTASDVYHLLHCLLSLPVDLLYLECMYSITINYPHETQRDE